MSADDLVDMLFFIFELDVRFGVFNDSRKGVREVGNSISNGFGIDCLEGECITSCGSGEGLEGDGEGFVLVEGILCSELFWP